MRGKLVPVLNLRDLIEHAGAYHDGELTPAQVKIVEAHLAGCAKCRDYLGSYRTTVELAQSAMRQSDDDPDLIPEDLIKDILATAVSRKR